VDVNRHFQAQRSLY